MSDTTPSDETLKTVVRTKYASIAEDADSCCGPSSCGSDEAAVGLDVSDDYEEAADIAADADLDLGCGLPTDHADLQPGERVLDLGSGAGMDAFVARRDVGPDGHVHGVDFVEAMVEKAREHADDLDYDNVTFAVGDIEDLPVEDEAFDVILSNCVLNLVPDKERAFAEMARVLRPGGRFSVSDIVHIGPLPNDLRDAAEMYVGCVAGSMERSTYLQTLRDAGFTNVQVATEQAISLPAERLEKHLDDDQRAAVRSSDAGLQSVTVTGTRPTTAEA